MKGLVLEADPPLGARAAFEARGVRLRAHPPAAIVRLQIAPAPAPGGAAPALGAIVLPLAPNRTAGADPLALWLAPESWLLVSETQPPEAVLGALEPLARWRRCAAGDASHALERLELSGARAGEILASGCGLDLQPASFPAGACARTRFAHLALLVQRVAPETFALFVDRSLAEWLWDWLADAAAS